ncbi:hypothetical protein LPB19_12070 [Marinobacter salinisoli]|uniref:Uncharacterized protein n=1 Tax=Marinobacter salinisoli TaxID=2769486 RepID=A0ABX7MNV3_9GAMM|nr:hypothetical protein [Marinobacter salinisoli]QSP93928.1 hypothetical protein LPB19_12070 [Marinobacter salinisoli]
MYPLKQISNYFMLGCLALLLIGCGGGGGGGGGSQSSRFDPGTGFDGFVFSIAIATDGSGDIYVGGAFANFDGTEINRIARLNNDGTLDTGFDPGAGIMRYVSDVTPTTDGSGDIYIGGNFTDFIKRLNSDGSNDAGFITGTSANDEVLSIALATDGSGDIYVGGNFTLYRGNARDYITRINNDGSNDAGFVTGTGFNAVVTSVALANDGSGDIYAGGPFSLYRGNARDRIVRVNSSGSNDAGFDPGTGFNFAVFSIVPAADGSGDLYVGGRFTDYDGTTRNRIVRLNSDGSHDAGFDSGLGFNDVVLSIALATDGSGDIYVGGDFTDYHGTARRRIARLNSDGSLDAGFDPGTGFDQAVWSIAPVSGGSIYVGGGFASYRSASANGIIRLDSTGTPN